MSSYKFLPLSFCFTFSHVLSVRLSLIHSFFNVTAMLKMLIQDAGIIHCAIHIVYVTLPPHVVNSRE